ncbi:hypothetical protein IAT40_005520 [Kwoniella sp. CBS 6097]
MSRYIGRKHNSQFTHFFSRTMLSTSASPQFSSSYAVSPSSSTMEFTSASPQFDASYTASPSYSEHKSDTPVSQLLVAPNLSIDALCIPESMLTSGPCIARAEAEDQIPPDPTPAVSTSSTPPLEHFAMIEQQIHLASESDDAQAVSRVWTRWGKVERTGYQGNSAYAISFNKN